MARTYFVVGSDYIERRHFANLKTIDKSTELYSWRRFSTEGVTQKLANYTGNAAVSIATTTDIQAGIVSLCVAHGGPLYIEKLLAFNRTEFDKIYSINADLQKRSMVGFMLRYHLLTVFLINLPWQNFFRMQLEIGHDVGPGRENWRLTESYAARTKGGIALLGVCHEIDLMGMICLDLTLRDFRSVKPAALSGVDIASALSCARIVEAWKRPKFIGKRKVNLQ